MVRSETDKRRCVCVSSVDEGERVGQKSVCEWGAWQGTENHASTSLLLLAHLLLHRLQQRFIIDRNSRKLGSCVRVVWTTRPIIAEC